LPQGKYDVSRAIEADGTVKMCDTMALPVEPLKPMAA
jgi:hypothetical protein